MVLVQKELKNAYIWEYVPPYLCFTANEANSTVKLNKSWSPTAVTLETSTDWTNWNTYTFGSTITLSNIWDKVYWRNTSESDTWFSTSSSNMYYFQATWSIAASGDINYLLNKNSTLTLTGNYCFYYLFSNCGTSLTSSPKLTATQLTQYCYSNMFRGCSNLETINNIPAENSDWVLPPRCCQQMYQWCTKIKISSSQTWEYQTPYRIPTTWDLVAGTYALDGMFTSTWWTFTWTPTINTTYYTSNTVV